MKLYHPQTNTELICPNCGNTDFMAITENLYLCAQCHAKNTAEGLQKAKKRESEGLFEKEARLF